MANEKSNKKTESFDLKKFLSVQKNRSRVYTGLFIILAIIFFIVNNVNDENGEGPYPPDYKTPKPGNFKTAPAFTLNNIEGTELSLEEYKGKVVLLEFWATWCKACQKLTPDLIQLKNDNAELGFEIVSISLDEYSGHDNGVVKEYIEKTGINYPVLIGNEKVVKKYGNVETTPAIFIIDKNSRIYSIYSGLVPTEVLIRDINSLL